MSGYRINEDDINRVIRYLKANRPGKATREYAIQILEIIHKAAKKLANLDPNLNEEIEKAIAELDNDSGDDIDD